MEKNPVIQHDILRYKKNKLAALLAILGLVFSALYFMILYALDADSFYTIYIGISVIVTLLVLLIAFYCSESVKNYKKAFCIVLLVLTVIQIIRIFYYPVKVLDYDGTVYADKWQDGKAFGDAESIYVIFYFTFGLTKEACGTLMIIYLIASAACFAGSAALGYITAMRLEMHLKKIESGEVDIEAVLKETDAFAIDNSVTVVNKEVE